MFKLAWFFFSWGKTGKGGKMAYRAHCDIVLMAAVHSWKCPNFRSCLFFEFVGFKKRIHLVVLWILVNLVNFGIFF
jgi:hypothetical protein